MPDGDELIKQAEWRGRMEATLSGLITSFNHRMDRQDEKLASIETQAKITNGRVTELETVNAHRDGIEEEKAKGISIRRLEMNTGVVLLAAITGGVTTEIAKLILG